MPFAKARNEQVHVFLDGNDNNKIEVQVILLLLRHDHEKDVNQVYINIFLMVVAISLHKSRSWIFDPNPYSFMHALSKVFDKIWGKTQAYIIKFVILV